MQGLRFLVFVFITGLLACEANAPTDATTEAVGPSFSASTSTISFSIETSGLSVFVPCASGGAGEEVFLSGPLHLVIHTTTSSSGVVTRYFSANPQGIVGIGQLTGDKYQGTGVSVDRQTATVDDMPATLTLVSNFLLIGPGPGNNRKDRFTFHTTVNANGDATATIENFSASCD